MAINCYTGLMGSGKTYEVVASVILPAIKSGRNVVTNIRGLNYEAICAHLGKPIEGREFGKIRVVKNDEVTSEDFFPSFVDQKFVVGESTIVKPGDLVAIDEAWRPWGTDSKCIKAHMSFFREHRQCVNERGECCDLVVITQDISDIHKLLKNVIELSFLFTKLKTLGLYGRYRAEVYEGSKLYKTKKTGWSTRGYDKRIFPLYKSYASDSGAGVERVVDGRQNIFKSAGFVMPLVLAVVFIVGGVWWLKGYFMPDSGKLAGDAKEEKPAAVEAGKPVPAAPVAAASIPAGGAGSSVVSDVGIAGAVVIGGDTWVVLNHAGGLKVVSPSAVYSRGVSAIARNEGGAVQAYLMR